MSLTDELQRALRYAGRHPGTFFAASSLLATGIAACIVVASLAHGLLWGDLPYRDPDQLVYVFEARPNQGPSQGVPASIPTFEDWKVYNVTLDSLARVPMEPTPSVMLSGEPERIQCYALTSGVLRTLGVETLLGRSFAAEEESPGGNPNVLLLSYDFWKHRMEQDPGILGEKVALEDGIYTVIGVMPEHFTYPPFIPNRSKADMWVPTVSERDEYNARDRRKQLVIARIKRGITFQNARHDLQEITVHIGEIHPETNADWGVRLSPIRRRFIERSESRNVFFLLGVSVIGVLLLASVNAAGILSARSVERSREMALRSAVGADYPKLLRGLFWEGVLLAVISTIGAVLVSEIALRSIEGILPRDLPRVDAISLDIPIVYMAILLGCLVSIISSIFPFLQYNQFSPYSTLHESNQTPNNRQVRVSNVIVFVHISIVTMLLAISLTVIMRFHHLLESSVDSLSVDGVLIAQIGSSHASSRDSHAEILARLRSIPGMHSATLAAETPLGKRQYLGPLFVTTDTSRAMRDDRVQKVDARMVSISSRYFSTLGMLLLEGRDFSKYDNASSERVVIVSRSLASLLQINKPLGARIRVGGLSEEWLTVIGVAADAPSEFGRFDPTFYIPLAQLSDKSSDDLAYFSYKYQMQEPSIALRSNMPSGMLAPAIRETVWQVDKSLPVTVRSLDSIVRESGRSERITALTFGCFGLLASFLAGSGVFGVLAFHSRRRIREIGLRRTFGASQGQIVWSMVSRTMRMSLGGVLIGTGLAVAVQGFLFSIAGIEGSISLTAYLASGTTSLALALVAASYPVARAAARSPSDSLRYE